MTKQTFNVPPYFDDFDSKKNFMKVLFAPSRPVQSRELNQIQSIFSNQIEKFANHVFKNGSRVSNGRAALNAVSFVKLDPYIPNTTVTNFDDPSTTDVVESISVRVFNDATPFTSTPFDTSLLINSNSKILVRGEFTKIEGFLTKSVPATESDPITLYLIYTKTAIDGKTATFINGEVLSFYANDYNTPIFINQNTQLFGRVPILPLGQSAIGKGKVFTIDEGIFYYEGLFIETPAQDILVSKYGEQENIKIGFDFIQEVVTAYDDVSLYDNALGYPNKTAQGADRFKCSLRLTVRPYENDNSKDFILLATYINGGFTYLKSDSEYADLMDMLAKRTYETHGNYTVKPYKVRFINDKADYLNDPLGNSINGSDDHIQAVVSPGISYVRGYRHEITTDTYVKLRKARDTKKMKHYIKRFEEKAYIKATPAFVDTNLYPGIPTHPSAFSAGIVRIWGKSSTVGDTAPPFDPDTTVRNSGLQDLGYCRIYDMVIESGEVGHPNNKPVVKYYIYNLSLIPGKTLADAVAYTVDSDTSSFQMLAVDSKIYNPNNAHLLWKIDKENIKSLRAITDTDTPNPSGSIIITIRRKLTGVLNSVGELVFNSNANEFYEPFNSNTTMAFLSGTNAATGVWKSMPLSASNTTVTPTYFKVKFDAGYNGASVTILHNVTRVDVQEDTKTLAKTTISDLSLSQDWYTLTQPDGAGFVDVYKLQILTYSPQIIGGTETDVTDKFIIDTGINDYEYGQARIKPTTPTSVTLAPGQALKIIVEYFNHSRPTGYFNVDSYRGLLNDPTIDFNYEDAPYYTAGNKEVFPVLQSFDFRPSFYTNVMTSGGFVPAQGSTCIFDIEYYLGRVDTLCIDKQGNIFPNVGEPSDTPRAPKPLADSMVLYEIYLKPYTYSLKDIKTKFIENKRYTMRDIGKLEARIENVEYYVSLSLLEKSAADMSIKDANGMDRFKNGFVVDDFSSMNVIDFVNTDCQAAIDTKAKEMRPKFLTRSRALKLKNVVGTTKRLGSILMNDYTTVILDEQPFATKHISINPYFQYKKMGTMFIFPNCDTWADTTEMPELTVEVNTGVDAFTKAVDAGGLLGAKWGSWAELNRTVVGNASSTVPTADGGTATTTTITTQTSSQRSGTNTTVESRRDSYDLGDRVTDVRINPYMRAVTIMFFVTGLKPNTQVYAFFDKKPVSEYCRTFRNTRMLVSDSKGQLSGRFDVPAKKFFTGTKDFYLTADKNLTGDADLEVTAASATFFAGGLDLTTQHTTLNVITPDFRQTNISESKITTDQQSSTVVTAPPPPPPPPVVATPVSNFDPQSPPPPPPAPVNTWEAPLPSPQRCSVCNYCDNCYDPVAQSFKIKQDCFITGIDLYFQSVDAVNDDIKVSIRNMVNGYPGNQILSERVIATKSLIISSDSTIPFHVEFNTPVYVQKDTEYCFVIQGYSPDTRVWVSRLGQSVVNMPGKIVETQPSLGSSFRSQNASTWNAEQFEDIKYRLYIAKFKATQMELTFEPEHLSQRLVDDPFEAEIGRSVLRVYCHGHGFSPNDKVSLKYGGNLWIPVKRQVGRGTPVLYPDMTIVSNYYTGVVLDVRASTTADAVYDIKVGKGSGHFSATDNFYCAGKVLDNSDNHLIKSHGFGDTHTKVEFKEFYGVFLKGMSDNGDIAINGIPFSQLFKNVHIIKTVDTNNSFIIQVDTNASWSGRFGGNGIMIDLAEKYEVFNVSGSYLPYQAKESWSLTGIGHNIPHGAFETDNYQTMKPVSFNIGEDVHLGQPFKIASLQNEIEKLGAGRSSVLINASLTSPSEYLSPVINLDTFSMITVHNHVSFFMQEDLDIEPNAIGRYKNEYQPKGTSGTFKYITKPVNLKQPATDLKIMFDVYKDVNADFDVYVKILSIYKQKTLDALFWRKLIGYDKSFVSTGLNDMIEVEIVGSKMQMTITGNEPYLAWGFPDDANNLTELFSSFQLKIVGRTKNPAKPPIFKNLRIIAVT